MWYAHDFVLWLIIGTSVSQYCSTCAEFAGFLQEYIQSKDRRYVIDKNVNIALSCECGLWNPLLSLHIKTVFLPSAPSPLLNPTYQVTYMFSQAISLSSLKTPHQVTMFFPQATPLFRVQVAAAVQEVSEEQCWPV